MKPKISSRSWEFRVQDILKAINKIEKYVGNRTLEQFRSDDLTIDAVIRNFEIIGEAGKQIPSVIQESYPDVPWNKLAGMRNLLIHEYFSVSIDIVWHTAKTQLPALKELLEKVISPNS